MPLCHVAVVVLCGGVKCCCTYSPPSGTLPHQTDAGSPETQAYIILSYFNSHHIIVSY